MDLRSLIESHLDVARLGKDLDELGPGARAWSIRQWTPLDMATLWEAAKGFRRLSIDHFVPPSVPPLIEVIHDGKNSLPAFTHFEKRFCRPRKEPGDILLGYNHQAFSGVTGPGYFVAHPSAEPDEVEIDYTTEPSEKPKGWPPILRNSARLGRFVYEGTIDVMRGISSHVSIGRGRKKKGWMDAWFVLVREDPATAALLATPSEAPTVTGARLSPPS